jgi:NADH dehydrogenase
MAIPSRAIVTGSYGYSGKYITRRLLELGVEVATLTSKPMSQSPFGDRVLALPFEFEQPAKLVEKLRGYDVVVNTYWVRFCHGQTTYGQAVANTQNLIWAAKEAGVRRFVHISITNPSLDSKLPYFRGKAVMEDTLIKAGLSYAILRPTVLFGKEDILLNNIAWVLRRFPIFGVFGDGGYRIQPVYVDDLAELVVDHAQHDRRITIDAVGPEMYSYAGLVRRIGGIIGKQRPLWHMPRALGFFAGKFIGFITGDVLVTKDEIEGLSAGLLVSEDPPTGKTALSTWIEEHQHELGTRYASELERHYR